MRHSQDAARLGFLKLLLGAMQLHGTLAQNIATTDSSTAAISVVSSSPSPTTSQSSTTASSSTAQTHTIRVGLADHKMRPEATEAAVGDIIEFEFYPLNHSVVRAEYGFPCIPYEMTGSGKKGFFSNFYPIDEILDSPPTYSIQVNDTEPILFYCSAPGSCITWGMVGGINLNSSMNIDRQRTLALDSAYMLQPGEPFPAEGPLSSGNPVSSVLPPSSTDTNSAQRTAGTSSGGLSTGVIIAIVIAAVGALLFGALLFFCWGRAKSLREEIERKGSAVHQSSTNPEQMIEHAHSTSHAGFQFPSHPGNHPRSHPGSPDLGAFGHQHHPSMGEAGYFSTPAGYMTKYATSAAAHPAYHAVSPGSPPTGSMGLNSHLSLQQPSPRGTPAPGHYDILTPGQDRTQGRAVEMEAVETAVHQAEEHSHINAASKF